ncbi:MAG: SGNH/GDSL hydrolase family protein [Defluviitaleaceae bacterium]|nr:SGNH/GDSL hydrolase family protein [Defluviitaleaceae bacterium]
MRWVKIFSSIIAFVLVFFVVQRLLVPKYATVVLEGGLIREYYSSNFDHNVVFIGDCEVYANFSPITLWDEFGITSFLRGSPQQLIWQSYYLFHDTLRFETPDVVVFNVLAMQYNEPQYEPYNRLTLDGMRWSRAKFSAISASRLYDESWLSYFLPFFRYKDRWRDISGEDFRYFFRSPRVSINGFMIRSDVVPAGFIPAPLPRANFQFGDTAYYYLDRMVQLAAHNDINLVLVKAPTLYPHWHAQWDEQMVDFAQRNNLLYINFLEYIEAMGLDFDTDTFNAGLHLNVFGAEKLARFFGEILLEHFDLPDRRNESDTAAAWNNKSELYHRIIERQQAEISTYGRIINFLIN